VQRTLVIVLLAVLWLAGTILVVEAGGRRPTLETTKRTLVSRAAARPPQPTG